MGARQSLEVPMTAGDVTPAPGSARWLDAVVVAVLMAAIAVALGAHLALSRTLNVNWDEWSYLSKVHAWVRGDALGRLQTFHVHLFAPLLLDGPAPDRELVEVLRLRLVSWSLVGASALSLIHLGWRLLGSVVAGLAAAFAALTFSFVLGHGTAARYDPFIVTAFLVGAVLVVEGQRARTTARATTLAAIAGGVLAVGAAVSIKIALFAPTLAGFAAVGVVAAVDVRARRRALLAAAVVAIVAVVGWRGLLSWHGASVVPVPATTTAMMAAPATSTKPTGLVAQLSSIGTMMFAGDSDGPQRKYLRMSQRYDRGFWGLAALGLGLGLVVIAGVGPAWLRGGASRAGMLRALFCAVPLVSLLVYRNTYPYFFVTVIPPAALLVGAVVSVAQRALSSWPRARALVVLVVCAPLAFTGVRFFKANHDDQQDGQRQVLAAVHAVFPTPVPYVDRGGMIASHPRVGPFMSSATLSAYRAAGVPVWPGLLDTARPRYLINNIASLDLRDIKHSATSRYRWLPDDFVILQESFIPHWGTLLWVAGRVVEVGPDGTLFPMHIPGRYVVDAPTPVMIDDVVRAPGAVIDLGAGPHRAASSTAITLTLRTAEAGPPPTAAPPTSLFTTFKPRGVPRPWFRSSKASREPVDEEAP